MTAPTTSNPVATSLFRRLLTVSAGIASIPALAGVGYVAAHAVSDTPSPQQVIPIESHTSVGDDANAAEVRGREAEPADDRNTGAQATNDDSSTTSTTSQPTAPATGELRHGADDGPLHDVNDDHGGTTTPTTEVGDDSSNRGPGSDDSGHTGSDDSGSEDSGHSGSDDSGHGGRG
jgi:hypothetical protein